MPCFLFYRWITDPVIFCFPCCKGSFFHGFDQILNDHFPFFTGALPLVQTAGSCASTIAAASSFRQHILIRDVLGEHPSPNSLDPYPNQHHPHDPQTC
jgi:hypothetical protein